MESESLDLDKFLDEMVTLINERFKSQERKMENLKKEIEELRRGMEKIRKGKQIDRRVLRVLGGK